MRAPRDEEDAEGGSGAEVVRRGCRCAARRHICHMRQPHVLALAGTAGVASVVPVLPNDDDA
eukprot:scaffold4963_cov202-Prasinococcus_capsulatus_cf.AAC.2